MQGHQGYDENNRMTFVRSLISGNTLLIAAGPTVIRAVRKKVYPVYELPRRVRCIERLLLLFLKWKESIVPMLKKTMMSKFKFS